MTLYSGNAALDRYLDEGFDGVIGMSSRFATAISGHLLTRQTALGIAGAVAEIGVFQGRFFIALAKAAAAGERALAIDPFTWPDAGIRDQFLGNCRAHGLADETVVPIAADSTKLSVRDVFGAAGGPVRFWHIDGDHTAPSLTSDLDLAAATLHPRGLVCVDDMLHPHYPLLTTALHDWRRANRGFRALAVIDRVSVIQAAKVVLCRTDEIETYRDDLVAAFPRFHWAPGSAWDGYMGLVLTQQH